MQKRYDVMIGLMSWQ